MAITATATIGASAASLPTGYTPPTLPTITVQATESYTVDLAVTLADAASAPTGIANILAALVTDFTTTQAPRLGLDATATIAANVTAVTVTRVNTNDSIFITGVEKFRCVCSVQWD